MAQFNCLVNEEKHQVDADQIIEKTYEAPFLPHNPMEPQNIIADVTPGKVRLVGPIQTPERTRKRVAELLNREENDISVEMTRMGGGFTVILFWKLQKSQAWLKNQ